MLLKIQIHLRRTWVELSTNILGSCGNTFIADEFIVTEGFASE